MLIRRFPHPAKNKKWRYHPNMKKVKFKTRSVTAAAIIGAAYAALTMMLAPLSYGAIQLRISEVLCILPFFIPSSAWGLFIGCAIANVLTGNVFDIIFGSLATLAAGLLTAYIGKRGQSMKNSILACLMPVLFNAVVVGAVITEAYIGVHIIENFEVFAMNALYVGIGEAVVLFVIGLPLMRYLSRNRFFKEYADKINS